MALNPHQAYEAVVEFSPPLSTLAQYADLCRKTCSANAQLVALTAKSARVVLYYPQGSPLGVGSVIFKVAGSGKASAAIIRALGPSSVRSA